MALERVRWWHGALLGVATGAVALGVAQLAAGLIDPASAPIVTVGQAAIDATPEWLKAWAIRSFGAADKAVLLGGMTAVIVTVAALLGIVAIRRPGVAIAGLLALGALGAAAAMSRPAAGQLAALPAIAGTGAALVVLRWLRSALVGGAAAPEGPVDVARRRFLLTASGALGVALVAGGVGAALGRRFRADGSRATVRVPRPDEPAPALGDVDPRVPGASAYLTPNDTFYRVDTALLVPSVTAEEWGLRVHGMVDREVALTYADLLSMPLIERDVTLTCVSNEIGGDLAGNARWTGVRLQEVLEMAGVQRGADQLVSRSADGWTCGTPTSVAMDGRDAMLAVAMNGEPLPVAHGFPVRMVIPGLYGYVSATKWVVDLELTTFAAFDPYWIQRGWAEQAPIETQSRIDVPRHGATVDAGEVTIAGVAWAQHTGIDRVEIRVDDGAWEPTTLADEATADTWRLWSFPWDAVGGEHLLTVRATDRTGATQTDVPSPPFPDGATGYHMIVITVR